MASIVSYSVSRRNSRCVVSISHITMPSENRSLRRSISSPRHCSGDRYVVLPLIVPALVSVVLARVLATPKSTTFTLPSNDTIRFDGVTSRCTMPSGLPSTPLRSCACWRPAAAPPAIASTVASEISLRLARVCCRSARTVSPCTYSIVKKYESPSFPTSCTCAMFGCWSCETRRASSRNMPTKFVLSAYSWSTRFKTT